MCEGSSEVAGKAVWTCPRTIRICFVPSEARAPNATPTPSPSTGRQSPQCVGSEWRGSDNGPPPPPPPPQPVHSRPTATTKRVVRAHRCSHLCHCLTAPPPRHLFTATKPPTDRSTSARHAPLASATKQSRRRGTPSGARGGGGASTRQRRRCPSLPRDENQLRWRRSRSGGGGTPPGSRRAGGHGAA